MVSNPPDEHVSPWRPIFEAVRKNVGHKRDANGVLGSINWLRKEMERRGANPNVVRNIIYRDKGKLADKRVLFEILGELWKTTGQPPLRAPELEVLLSPGSSAEQEVLQLLGREKRRAYRGFVGGVRSGETPHLLITGRPGSGKTLLADYIQQALEIQPRAADHIVRLEFSSSDLASALSRLALALGVPSELIEAKLLRIGSSSAFAVQADAQAEVARVIIDAARQAGGRTVFLLHVSQSMAGQDSLGLVPLRLNTPEVPRVSASEWLWLSLIEPLGRLPDVAVLASMADVPARAMQRLGAFEGPVKLTPPTAAEARRFVRARLPHLPPAQQDDIVQRAGRSFEELRTLTLLAEVRDPVGATALEGNQLSIEQLSKLVEASGDARLRDFLSALATLSIPEFPTFQAETLLHLRADPTQDLNAFELAFLDQVPGDDASYRCFSRQLARALRQRLQEADPARYRWLNRAAADAYRDAAWADPTGESASRFLHHVFEARDWDTMASWLQRHSIQQSLVRRIWHAAETELSGSPDFHGIARQVAAHYVKLGSYDHADALSAFDALSHSEDADVRAWTTLKRAEGEVLKGRFEQAEHLLEACPGTRLPLLRAEVALVRASIARWRSDLDDAARLVDEDARNELQQVTDDDSASSLARAKVAVWAGLIAKDRGDLEGALRNFGSVVTDEDLIRARLAFQKGDVCLKLGRFDQALRELDLAVELAHRSEALVQEQTRYLARRGTLYRRMGDLGAADRDFDAARTILEFAEAEPVERDFWVARVDDEAALALLAEGAFEEATFTLTRNIERFRAYADALEVDAEYRVLRSTLYIGLAYACRGLGLPFRLPLPVVPLPETDQPDLRHARQRIGEVLAALDAKHDRELHGVLVRQAHLHASLVAASGAEALDHAEKAVAASRFEYQRAEALAAAVAARLRMDDAHGAVGALSKGEAALRAALPAGGRQERGDLGLRAQYVALAGATQLQLGASGEAAERLASALEDPDLAAYHEGLLRAFGEGAERMPAGDGAWRAHPRLGELLGLGERPDVGPARLPDALVARWRNRRRAPVGAAG
ncbi:MAG: hypothetical protein P8Y02_07355 [Deinococcales bacterium]